MLSLASLDVDLVTYSYSYILSPNCGLFLFRILCMCEQKLNFAMQNKNPVDHVHFYSKHSLNQKFLLPKTKISRLIPEEFQVSISVSFQGGWHSRVDDTVDMYRIT